MTQADWNPQKEWEETLREIYERCDVSNNRTENPLNSDEFVAAINKAVSEIVIRDDELGEWVQTPAPPFDIAPAELHREVRMTDRVRTRNELRAKQRTIIGMEEK